MTDRLYSMLGLATKARQLVSGEDACEMAIKSEKALLVIVAEDASENTKKSFNDACKYRNISIRFYGSKEDLSRYIGKNNRAVVAILNKNFANGLLKIFDGTDT